MYEKKKYKIKFPRHIGADGGGFQCTLILSLPFRSLRTHLAIGHEKHLEVSNLDFDIRRIEVENLFRASRGFEFVYQ
jgi:hypothetical protein